MVGGCQGDDRSWGAVAWTGVVVVVAGALRTLRIVGLDLLCEVLEQWYHRAHVPHVPQEVDAEHELEQAGEEVMLRLHRRGDHIQRHNEDEIAEQLDGGYLRLVRSLSLLAASPPRLQWRGRCRRS